MSARFQKSIVWLRRDLRSKDHRALFEATQISEKVIPVFIIDETIVSELPSNDRRITFIQNSLDELNAAFEKHGGRLLVLHGNPVEVIPEIAKTLEVEAVFTANDYEPRAKKRDALVAKALASQKIEFFSFKDQVIFERLEIVNGSKEPYKVFTPYSNNWLKQFEAKLAFHLTDYKPNLKKLWPAAELKQKNKTFWDFGFQPQKLIVDCGEKAAHEALKKFENKIKRYHELRDYPALEGTSKISIHLRFGTISIRECLRFAYEHLAMGTRVWVKELVWREFYQMILDQYPHVEKGAFREDYAQLKWPGKKAHFEAWCEGMTGYPIVDAAMREFKTTGWMHNRLRMVVAMFLTKDLLIDWRHGEKYFASLLLDFDLASNNGGWQWSASTGCDAQPYFRVMNPISQSERFDGEGEYIKKWVPELKGLTGKQIHWPHEEDLFRSAMGDYPAPIVDHATQRVKAIALFKK